MTLASAPVTVPIAREPACVGDAAGIARHGRDRVASQVEGGESATFAAAKGDVGKARLDRDQFRLIDLQTMGGRGGAADAHSRRCVRAAHDQIAIALNFAARGKHQRIRTAAVG